jgi:hypothetical protein
MVDRRRANCESAIAESLLLRADEYLPERMTLSTQNGIGGRALLRRAGPVGSADENLTGSTGFARGQQGPAFQGVDCALCPYEHLALRLAIAPAVYTGAVVHDTLGRRVSPSLLRAR